MGVLVASVMAYENGERRRDCMAAELAFIFNGHIMCSYEKEVCS